jgi:hypothetical protein
MAPATPPKLRKCLRRGDLAYFLRHAAFTGGKVWLLLMASARARWYLQTSPRLMNALFFVQYGAPIGGWYLSIGGDRTSRSRRQLAVVCDPALCAAPGLG